MDFHGTVTIGRGEVRIKSAPGELRMYVSLLQERMAGRISSPHPRPLPVGEGEKGTGVRIVSEKTLPL